MNSPSYLNVKRERDHNNNLIDENNKITDKLNEDYYLIYNNINLLNAYAHYICTHTEQPLNEIFIYLVITNKNNYNDYQKILNNLFLPYNNAKSKLTILLNNVHLFTSKENNILSDEYKEKIAPIENIDISKLNEYKWSSIKQILFILSDSSLLSEYVLNNANTPDFCSIVDYSSKKEKTKSQKIISMLPFMDKEDLHELVNDILNGSEENKDIPLQAIFPFLSEEDCNSLFLKSIEDPNSNIKICSLAPFVSEEALSSFVDKYIEGEYQDVNIDILYPFLKSSDIKKLFKYVVNKE